MDDHSFEEILVLGLGTVGCRLAAQVKENLPDYRYVFIDTDRRSLRSYENFAHLFITTDGLRGWGTGKRPKLAKAAAEEHMEDIRDLIGEPDAVIITASFGGGTGAGAASVVAAIAQRACPLTVVTAVDPFVFESPVRAEQAQDALLDARDNAEAIVRIPSAFSTNTDEAGEERSFEQAFQTAEAHAVEATGALVQMIANPGVIQLDLGDLARVLSEPGGAFIGIGRASGEHRVEKAVRKAFASTALDAYRVDSLEDVILYVSGENITTDEIDGATRILRGITRGEYRVSIERSAEPGDEVSVTLLMSGCSGGKEEKVAEALENSATEGAFIYDGVNIDTPAYMRRAKSPYSRTRRLPPWHLD